MHQLACVQVAVILASVKTFNITQDHINKIYYILLKSKDIATLTEDNQFEAAIKEHIANVIIRKKTNML